MTKFRYHGARDANRNDGWGYISKHVDTALGCRCPLNGLKVKREIVSKLLESEANNCVGTVNVLIC